MDNQSSSRSKIKTNADESSRIFQMQAAAALKTGDFAAMFRLDARAQATRRAAQTDFFQIGLVFPTDGGGKKTAQTPIPAARTAATGTTRRIFKVAR